jgi:predicted dehydrogenase
VKFGLAGTGYWAQVAHARALTGTDGAELAAVWGRNPGRTAARAGRHAAAAHADFAAAVASTRPPPVPPSRAVRAAAAGKHLLLEKPVALTAASADALTAAVAAARVASVVFFTARFQPDIRAWLTAAGGAPWSGAQVVWLGSAVAAESPFNTPWRQREGGLWDLGPHALSVLTPALGPVESVLAGGGPGDVAHLILRHTGGASSTVTVTLQAPPGLDGFDLALWGERGRSQMPPLADDPLTALRTAVTELITAADSADRAHSCDVRFGAAVTAILEQASRQIQAG